MTTPTKAAFDAAISTLGKMAVDKAHFASGAPLTSNIVYALSVMKAMGADLYGTGPKASGCNAALKTIQQAVNAYRGKVTGGNAAVRTLQQAVNAYALPAIPTPVPTPTPTPNPAPPPPPPAPRYSEPIVAPAAPVLSNPSVINSTQLLGGTNPCVFSNRVGGCPLAYAVKDSAAHIPSIEISDHDLTGCAGLLRAQDGRIDYLGMKRVRLLQGVNDPSVIAGILHVAHAAIGEFLMEDCDYERIEGIDSGDIYAGLFTGGGHKPGDPTPYGSCDKFTIRNCRAKGMWTNYTTGYPNSDGIVFESSFTNGLIDTVDLTDGADAGIDRKGPNCVVRRAVVRNFRESFKTWDDAHDEDVYSYNPRFAHWLLSGVIGDTRRREQTVAHVKLTGSDPKVPVVNFQRSKWVLDLGELDLHLPDGQVLATCDSDARGSVVILSGKTYDIAEPLVYL